MIKPLIMSMISVLLSGCLLTSGGNTRNDIKNTADAKTVQENVSEIVTATNANDKQLEILDNQAIVLNSKDVGTASEIIRYNNETIKRNARKALGTAENIENRSDGYFDWKKLLFWIGIVGLVILLTKFGLWPLFIGIIKWGCVNSTKFLLNVLEDNTVHDVTKRS